MLAVGGHCECSPATHKPTYTTAFRHKNERNIPCTDDDGELTSCSSNKYTLCQIYQIYSTKLG